MSKRDFTELRKTLANARGWFATGAPSSQYVVDRLELADELVNRIENRLAEATALLAWWANETELADSDDAVSVMDSAIREFLAAAHA